MRRLTYDVEIAPNLSWCWGTGKQNVGAHQILRPFKIISIAYRFSDWEPGRVDHLVWKPKKRDHRLSYPYSDKELVTKFYKIAEKADILIGYNGNNFDRKIVNTRLAYYKLGTLDHHIREDPLLQLRKSLRLPSFKLDFVCKYFNVPGKLSTVTGLWEKVAFFEDNDALEQMILYNKNDVVILDKVGDRIFSYVLPAYNRSLETGAGTCPRCGSDRVIKDGFKYTTLGKYQRYKCKSCGHKCRDGINLIKSSLYLR